MGRRGPLIQLSPGCLSQSSDPASWGPMSRLISNPDDRHRFRRFVATNERWCGHGSPPALQAETAVGLRGLQGLDVLAMGIGECSAGCSPGKYDGKQWRCTPSGTCSCGLTCQPAPSSPGRIGLLRPVPTAWTYAASATVKAIMATVGSSSQHVRPDGGWKTVYREDHGYRCWTTAGGRCPGGTTRAAGSV
jgi:hypothetical protein